MKKLTACLLCLLLLLPACTFGKEKRTATFTLFDTYCSFTCYQISETDFDTAYEKLYELLSAFHEETDIYHEYSSPNLATLNRLAGQEAVSLSEQLIEFLQYGIEAYHISGSRLNICLGPVTVLWHEARESGVLPSDEALSAASCFCDIANLVLTESTAYLKDSNARIDVGALAKGYAGRLAQELLNDLGISDYLLNLGGTIVTGGTPAGTGRSEFTIGIQSTDGLTGSYAEILKVAGGTCAATSGDYQRYIDIDGVRYHHLIDPDTLYPSAYQHSVTVVCKDPALADLLSTTLFMMTEADGTALASQYGATVYYH